jgi:hypothetical protein
MTLGQLALMQIEKLIFHSLDQSLYNVSAVVNGKETMITNEKGHRLTSRNLLELQQQFAHLAIKNQVLRQHSAYDEMIGGPIKTSNEMEIPIGDNKLY